MSSCRTQRATETSRTWAIRYLPPGPNPACRAPRCLWRSLDLDHVRHGVGLVHRTRGGAGEPKQLRVDVEFDRVGVVWLDEYVTRQYEQGDPTNVDGLVNTLGSFFGECIVRTHGGEWTQDEYGWCVRFDEHNAVYPFAKTEKHLRNGPEDSVLSMFDTVPLIFKRMGR